MFTLDDRSGGNLPASEHRGKKGAFNTICENLIIGLDTVRRGSKGSFKGKFVDPLRRDKKKK